MSPHDYLEPGELAAVREHHGWLWEEMTRHPRVAALIDELALWGF